MSLATYLKDVIACSLCSSSLRDRRTYSLTRLDCARDDKNTGAVLLSISRGGGLVTCCLLLVSRAGGNVCLLPGSPSVSPRLLGSSGKE